MSQKNNKLISKIPVSFIVLATFLILLVNKTYAASLSLLPSPSVISVGNIVSMKVYVGTDGSSINNADAVIQFPVDLLEVVSITKSSSIFSLWVEEPSFSNTTGKIIFNGGVPNPGYNGQSGYIATITFKAKKQGTASVIFTDGAVRQNDGLGTDILSSKNSGIIQIGAIEKIEVPKIVTENGAVPTKPVIFSDTHKDQDLWYDNSTTNFSWKVPSGVTTVQTLFDKKPSSAPTVKYDSSVTQKTLNNISDGTSYFHLRFFNAAGASLIAHYKINIDTVAPLTFVPTVRSEGNQNIIKLVAEDVTSGIDYYTIKIDDSTPVKVTKDKLVNNEYLLPILGEGSHNLFVTAYDKAGNYTESNITLTSSSITSPILSLSSNEITSGDSVVVFGKTDYPGKQVELTLEQNGKEVRKYTQKTADDGSFSINTDKIKTSGVVDIWAQIVFSENVKSQSSQKVYLKVNETEAIKITLSIFYPLIGLIVILLLLLVFITLLYLGWHKFLGLKKRIKHESQQTIEDVHRAMLLLKDELNDQLETLEKVKEDRFLNKKEETIFSEIEKNIENIDNFIENKLKKFNP